MGEMAREIPVTQQSVDTWLGHKLGRKLPTTSCRACVQFDGHILSILQQWVQILKRNFMWLLNNQNIHFFSKLGSNISEYDKIMLFKPKQPSALSVQASCRTDWTQTCSLRRYSGLQALQISTHWTITVAGPSVWNSSERLGRPQRQFQETVKDVSVCNVLMHTAQ